MLTLFTMSRSKIRRVLGLAVFLPRLKAVYTVNGSFWEEGSSSTGPPARLTDLNFRDFGHVGMLPGQDMITMYLRRL